MGRDRTKPGLEYLDLYKENEDIKCSHLYISKMI
jgi:hypothetical protein